MPLGQPERDDRQETIQDEAQRTRRNDGNREGHNVDSDKANAEEPVLSAAAHGARQNMGVAARESEARPTQSFGDHSQTVDSPG